MEEKHELTEEEVQSFYDRPVVELTDPYQRIMQPSPDQYQGEIVVFEREEI